MATGLRMRAPTAGLTAVFFGTLVDTLVIDRKGVSGTVAASVTIRAQGSVPCSWP